MQPFAISTQLGRKPQVKGSQWDLTTMYDSTSRWQIFYVVLVEAIFSARNGPELVIPKECTLLCRILRFTWSKVDLISVGLGGSIILPWRPCSAIIFGWKETCTRRDVQPGPSPTHALYWLCFRTCCVPRIGSREHLQAISNGVLELPGTFCRCSMMIMMLPQTKPVMYRPAAAQVRRCSCNHLCCSCPSFAARRCCGSCARPTRSRSFTESGLEDGILSQLGELLDTTGKSETSTCIDHRLKRQMNFINFPSPR